MYQRYLANVNQLEDQFAALWTQCQRCQVLTHSFQCGGVQLAKEAMTECGGVQLAKEAMPECARVRGSASATLLVWRIAAELIMPDHSVLPAFPRRGVVSAGE